MRSGRTGGRRRGGTLVGLDVQPGYIAAVQASISGVVAVQRAVGRPLPADIMREGEVLDEALLAKELRELFREAHLGRQVRIGLANQRTVVRMMELPPISDRKELAAAVSFQAADQIPMPLASAVLDFHPLGIVETPNGRRQRVVLVAAQRELVERLVRAVSAAGLRPAAVDLSAFAMIRALHRGARDGQGEAAAGEAQASGGEAQAAGEGLAAGEAQMAREASAPGEAQSPGGAAGRILYLDVGGLTNMAIAEGVTCRFTRTVSGGLESMAADLAQRHAISLTDARASIAGTDLGSGPVEEPLHAEAHAVLSAGVREIAGEVRNSLDFHRAQEGGGAVEQVVLSGSALEILGFAATLEAELGGPVSRRTVALSRGSELDGVSAERLTIAAGLAVEEVRA